MSVRTDVINLQINVNGNKALNELNDLRKKSADLNFELKGLKKGTEEYIRASAELSKVNNEIVDLKKQVGLTALSQKELNKELKTLTSLRNSVQPFTKEYDELTKSIEKVRDRLYDVNNGVQGFASFFSKIKDEVKQFGMLALGYVGFEFITQQFTSILQGAGKLSDQLADLQRVSGMSRAEVDQLNGSLSKIDTRTGVGQLRDISIVAGKLGVAKEDILDFVKATDMLVVSLGDELGDADQITTQLGKILNVFNGKVDGESLTRLGNAFVELANAGVASGGFISDFTQRVAGIAKASNLSLGATVGLGAGLEELGLRSESSSTALQTLLSTIANDLPKAAKIAGATTEAEVKAYIDLFAKTPEQALIKFAEGLTKNKGSFAEVTASFKEAGEEGARVVQVLQAIGQRGDFLRDKIDLGNKSIQESTAITSAFALKNDNLGATLDKLGKEFASMVSSPGVTNFLKSAVEGTLAFIKVLKDIPFSVIAGSIAFVVAAINGWTLATLRNKAATLVNIVTNYAYTASVAAMNIVTAIGTSLQAAYIVVTNLLAGSITRATAAQRLWNIVKSASLGAIGLVVVAITGLVALFNKLTTATDAASLAERTRTEIMKKAAEASVEEVSKVKMLTNVINDQSLSLDTRNAALKELIALNPEYLKGLTLENAATAEGTVLIDGYIKRLEQKARLEAATSVQSDLLKKDMELALQRQEVERGLADNKGVFSVDNSAFKYALDDIDEKRKQLQVQIATSGDLIKESFIALNSGDAMKQAETGFANSVANFFSVAVAETKEKAKKLREIESAGIFDRFTNYLGGGINNAWDRLKASFGKKADDAFTSTAAKILELQNKLKTLAEKRGSTAFTDGSGRAKIDTESASIQKQIDALEGKKESAASSAGAKAQSKDDSKYKNLLAEAERFHQDVLKLKNKAAIQGEEPEQREIDAVTVKYNEMMAKAKEYWLSHVTKNSRFMEDTLNLQTAMEDELNAIIKKYQDQRFKQQSQEEYKQSIENRVALTEDLKLQAAKDHADSKLTDMQYAAELRRIELNEKKDLVIIAQDYSATVKDAAKDVHKYRIDQERATTKLTIEEIEKRKEYEAKEQQAQLKRLVASTNNKNGPQSRQNLEYRKSLRGLEFTNDVKGKDVESEQYKERHQAMLDDMAEMDKEYNKGRLDLWMSYFDALSNVFTQFNNFLNARENAQLQRDKAQNDKKKDNYKRQLDNKLISQAQFDLKVNLLNEQQDKREREIKRKQAIREKALNIFNAILATASAIAKALPNIPLSIAAGIAGGLQVATIAATPLPELSRGRYLDRGDRHSDPSRGIPLVDKQSGKIFALAEKGEALMATAAMADPTVRTVTGTTKEITSALNSAAGGVGWGSGAQVVSMRPQWQTKHPAPIRQLMPKIMANGGPIRETAAVSKESAETNGLLRELIGEQRANREEMGRWRTRLKADVSIKEFRAKEQLYEDSRRASGM